MILPPPCFGAQGPQAPLPIQGPQAPPDYTSPGSPLCQWPTIEINEPVVMQLPFSEPASVAIGAQTFPCGDDCYRTAWDFSIGFPGIAGAQGAQAVYSVVSNVICDNNTLKVYRRDIVRDAIIGTMIGPEYYYHDAGCCNCYGDEEGGGGGGTVETQCCENLIAATLFGTVSDIHVESGDCTCVLSELSKTLTLIYNEVDAAWEDTITCGGHTIQFQMICQEGTGFVMFILCDGVNSGGITAEFSSTCNPFHQSFRTGFDCGGCVIDFHLLVTE